MQTSIDNLNSENQNLKLEKQLNSPSLHEHRLHDSPGGASDKFFELHKYPLHLRFIINVLI